MNYIYFCALAVSAVLTFTSCEKDLLTETDDEETEVSGQSPKATAHLNIITRGSGDSPNQNAVADGRIYIFNEAGQCVDLLTTSESSNQTSSTLPAGTYTLYALGSSDLSHFVLPTQQQASPSSVITRAENQTMCDLLQKTVSVTLENGESVTQNIVLDHKVLCIDQLEIAGVPDNVTKVEVSVSPLYKSIQLDGSYVTTATESYKIELDKPASGDTWQATPAQMLFPSKGTPNIKVSFTTAKGVKSYSYTASEELPANHHFTISGTYTDNSGIALTGILTASDWGEDRTITFGFDELSNRIPVAGRSFNGNYVISVDETNRTALVRSANIEYVAPAANSSKSDWLSALNTAMAAATKPANAVDNWRIPTYEEALVFVTDYSLYNGDHSAAFFCLDGNSLKWLQTLHIDTTPEIVCSDNFVSTIKFRAVITITY